MPKKSKASKNATGAYLVMLRVLFEHGAIRICRLQGGLKKA